MGDAPTTPDLNRLSTSELVEYSQRVERKKKRCEVRLQEIDEIIKEREG